MPLHPPAHPDLPGTVDGLAANGATSADEVGGRGGTGTVGAAAPRFAQRPRRGPALIVLALAVVIGGGGFVAGAITSGPGQTTPPASLNHLAGVKLPAVGAKALLRPVISAGQPPPDVLNALVVPERTTRKSSSCPSGGTYLYDCEVTLAVPSTPQSVVAFYDAELAHQHWSKMSVVATADGRGTEILAKRPSADGYYWELGVTIEPVNPSITPALGGGSETAPTSSLVLTVFEIDDAS